MPRSAPRLSTLFLVAAGACLTAAGVEAQTAGQATGRYLTWAGRPANAAAAAVATPAAVIPSRNDIIPRRVAPSQGAPRPAMQAPGPTLSASRGLTPASAWIGPPVAPTFAAGSPYPVMPEMGAPDIARPAPSRSPPPQPTAVQPAAADIAEPAYPPAATPTPQAASAETADPMAPRRDAPIFQIARQPRTASTGESPAPVQASAQAGPSGARYYSVHRNAGRRPDPTALPEPVYLDSVAVDLAEPPAVEPSLRDARGRRPAVANSDPNLP